MTGTGTNAEAQWIDDDHTCRDNHPETARRLWHCFAGAKGERVCDRRCPLSLTPEEQASILHNTPEGYWREAVSNIRTA